MPFNNQSSPCALSTANDANAARSGSLQSASGNGTLATTPATSSKLCDDQPKRKSIGVQVNETEEPFNSRFQRWKDNHKPSDLTIHCGDDSFEVHQAVVCPQCEFFTTDSPSDSFRRFIFKKPSSIIMPRGESLMTVQRLLSYLYTGDYGDVDVAHSTPFFVRRLSSTKIDEQRHELLVLHITMYACGDKYGVPPLKTLAQARFKELTTQHWPFKDFPALVGKVYAATSPKDRGLKDIIFQICLDHFDELMAGPVWTRIMEVEGTAALAAELLPGVVKVKDETIRSLQEHIHGPGLGHVSKKQKRDSGKSLHHAPMRT
ncbi:MAG: hypothetical protein Q9225_007419 [Loekoesia sp. 1 TL-2023]